MKKERILDNSDSMRVYQHRYGDLIFPEGWDKEIIEASDRLKQVERNDKIDKLLNED